MTALLELLATLLSTVATAGTSSFLGPHISNILSGTAALVRQGEAAVPILSALTGHVSSMVATHTEGTDPSAEDVATLQQHLDAAHASVAPAPTPAGGTSPSV